MKPNQNTKTRNYSRGIGRPSISVRVATIEPQYIVAARRLRTFDTDVEKYQLKAVLAGWFQHETKIGRQFTNFPASEIARFVVHRARKVMQKQGISEGQALVAAAADLIEKHYQKRFHIRMLETFNRVVAEARTGRSRFLQVAA